MKKRILWLLSLLFVIAGTVLGGLFYQGGLPIRTLAYEGDVKRLCFSPDGHFLAVIIRGKGISIWKAQNWKQLSTLPGNFDTCYFLPDSRTLIADSSYTTDKGPLADTINHGGGLTQVQWQQQESKMRESLQCWDITNHYGVKAFSVPRSSVESFAPKVNRIVLHRLGPRPGISILDTQNGQETHFFPAGAASTGVISPDGRWVGVLNCATQNDPVALAGIVTLWDTQTWQKKPLSTSPLTADIQFSPDGQYFAAFTPQAVTLWRTSDWKPQGTLICNYDYPLFVRFTLDSKQVITDGSWNKTPGGPPYSTLMIWDVGTGRRTATLTNQEQASWRLTSRGIVTLDTTNWNSILWNTKNGQRIWQRFVGYESEATISPDGQTLVTAHPKASYPANGGSLEIRHLPKS